MSMMRDPSEDKRTLMIRRLPEMMRILRTHFVTEKKPALPMQNIIQKLADSYKTTIRFGKFCILKWLQVIVVLKIQTENSFYAYWIIIYVAVYL